MSRPYTQLECEKFLDTVGLVLSVSREAAKKINESLAPDFCLMDVLSPDEMRLSAVLGAFLDPKGKHGQGSKFLVSFLKALSTKSADGAFFRKMITAWGNCEAVTVQFEAQTALIAARQRRMDILIMDSAHSYALMIENKPWAEDQADQLSDYAEQLRHLADDRFAIVYLAGSGNGPSQHSIASEAWEAHVKTGRTLSLGYIPTLTDWLTECEGLCVAEPVKAALRDFKRYIDRTFTAPAASLE